MATHMGSPQQSELMIPRQQLMMEAAVNDTEVIADDTEAAADDCIFASPPRGPSLWRTVPPRQV